MQVRSSDTYKNISRFRFDNGLTFLTKVSTELPIVSFRGCVRGGVCLEEARQSGLLKLMCLLLKGGTASRSAVALAEELDLMGSSLHFSPGYDALHVSLSSLSKHFEKSLEVLSDLWFHSVFPENEVERLRRYALAALKRKADQYGQVASDKFNELVFSGHPYRRSIDGYENTLMSLTRDDIISHHKKYIDPGRIILTAAGDFDVTRLTDLLIRLFDQPSFESASRGSDVQVNRSGETCIIHRDISQVHICLGNIAARRRSEDHYASMLMNYILGGSGLTSRLTHRIRTQKGLAYSVYSHMTKRLLGGTFYVTMQTKAENAGAAVQNIREELFRIKVEPVTDQEIQDAKEFFKGYFPFRAETLENEAAYIEMSEFYDLGLDYLDLETDQIANVSKQDIMQAAQKYVDHESFVLAMTGNKNLLPEQFNKS
jgi:zinc protease